MAQRFKVAFYTMHWLQYDTTKNNLYKLLTTERSGKQMNATGGDSSSHGCLCVSEIV
jgi:hypothetical protein